jgi:mono/diheme cytochrome c family protein
LRDPEFQDQNSDQDIFDSINTGHKATAMIGWGEILNSEQIEQLVGYIRQLKHEETALPTDTPLPGQPTFTADVLPIFEEECTICHGSLGGWDASSYEAVMTTGNNAPVVIPGDVENSLLAQKMLGTQTEGAIMPPTGKLSDDVIQIILDWIAGGAPE